MKKKKSKENNVKICKVPGCKKETHDRKSLFCLEHKRDIRDKGKKTEKIVGGIALLGISIIGKKFLDGKKF